MTIRNVLADEHGLLLDDDVRPGSCAQRRDRLGEPHIAPLEQWRRAVELKTQEAVPSFDPESGGVAARALILREEPRCKGSEGPRFVSIDTNDVAAHNTWMAYAASGLDRTATLHWNVVPWWVRNPAKGADGNRTLNAQAQLAGHDLQFLLDRLDRLELVVLLGRAARKAWDAAGVRGPEVMACPHPSPLAWHKTDRHSGVKNGDLIIATFREVAQRLGNPVRAASEPRHG